MTPRPVSIFINSFRCSNRRLAVLLSPFLKYRKQDDSRKRDDDANENVDEGDISIFRDGFSFTYSSCV